MFQKAAGFVRTLSKAGCETPASMYFDSVCQQIKERQMDSYQTGFAKIAQVTQQDAWKPVAATAGGAYLGGSAAAKLSPLLVGKGGRAKLMMTLLGLLGGGAAGNALTKTSPDTLDARMADRTARLSGDILRQHNVTGLMSKPIKAVPKPSSRSPFSFASGNPFDSYHDYMTR